MKTPQPVLLYFPYWYTNIVRDQFQKFRKFVGFSPQMFTYLDVSFFLNKPKTLFFFFNFQVSDIDALCVLQTRGNMQTSRNWKRCLVIPKFPNVVIITIQDAMTSSKSVLKTARAVLLNLKVITLYSKSLSVTSVAQFWGAGAYLARVLWVL